MTQIFISTIPSIGVIQGQPSVVPESVNLLQSAFAINSDERDHSYIALDEGDTFQCGKCRGKFSVVEFISHKKNKCPATSVIESSVLQIYHINSSENLSLVQDRTTPLSENVISLSFTESSFQSNNEKASASEQPFKLQTCDYCGKSFKKSYDLKQHIRCHTGERPFLCVVCGRAFKQKTNVVKHMDTHKVWPKDIRNLPSVDVLASGLETSGFFCQFCTKSFPKHSDWKSHLKTHVNQKVYKCEQSNCSRTFSDRESFIAHCQNHDGLSKFSCHVCSRDFSSLDELGHHHGVHVNHSSKKIKCNKCECVHPAEQNHSCRRHCCPLCDMSFVTPRSLRRHLYVHSSVASHPCDDCGKLFKSKKLLSSHRLSHTTAKPFVCTMCSAAFKRREKLTRHRKIHGIFD